MTAAPFHLVRLASLSLALLVVLALAAGPALAKPGASRARGKPAAAKPNKPAKESRSQTRRATSRRATNERAPRSFARSAEQQAEPQKKTRGRLFKAVAGGLVALGITAAAAMSFMNMQAMDGPGGEVMPRPPSVTAPQPVEDIRPGGPGTTFNPSVDWGGARR